MLFTGSQQAAARLGASHKACCWIMLPCAQAVPQWLTCSGGGARAQPKRGSLVGVQTLCPTVTPGHTPWPWRNRNFQTISQSACNTSHQQAVLLLLLLPGPAAEPLAAARLASGSEAICGEIWCARARWGPLTASLLHSAQLKTCRQGKSRHPRSVSTDRGLARCSTCSSSRTSRRRLARGT